MTDRIFKMLAGFSDQKLIESLHTVSGPLIKELARRGFDVRLDAPAPLARDGHDSSEFWSIRPAR